MFDKRNTTKHLDVAWGVSLFVGFFLLTSECCLCSGIDEPQAALSTESTLTRQELQIWNDPSFKKQFAESYIAETEIEPRVTADERERMLKVLELISSDKMNEAAALLQNNRNEASSAVFDFTLANIYFQQEKFEEAAAIYQTAVEKYPKFRRAWRNLGLIYIRQNSFDKALPALTRIVELGGGDTLTYGLLGFAYASAGNHLSAESAYRMAILLDPATLDWKMGLARSFFKQERFHEAVAITNQLIAGNPDRADLWLLQANAYIGLNQPSRAAEIFEMVNHLGHATPESLNTLGDIYINQELYALAVDAYTSAILKDPKYNPARAVRSANVLVSRGAFVETHKMLDLIESRFGESFDTETRKDVLKLRARLAVADGSGSEEEIRILKEIVELDPLDGEALILLGQHSGRTGDMEKAIFYFERVEGMEKYEADAKIRHAQLLVQKGKYDEALPLLRRAQQLNPRSNIQEYLEQIERVARAR